MELWLDVFSVNLFAGVVSCAIYVLKMYHIMSAPRKTSYESWLCQKPNNLS
jgi:hypothetical protein